jgi:microsomal dipeptidase-like Zn-dependent dipeptidase
MGQSEVRAASRAPLLVGGLAAALAVAFATWLGVGSVPSASAQAEIDRYSIANGCYALRSQSNGAWVIRDGAGYRAFADGLAGAEPFRMQATDLGRYLFYGPTKTFLTASGGSAVTAANQPSNPADWRVTADGGAFEIATTGKQLAIAGDGKLIAVPDGTAGAAGRFAFDATGGCGTYPEVQVNAAGKPSTGSPRYGEVSGLVEGHMHGMAFEFLGGKAHCGRPWHRFGAPYALVDCVDHAATNGCGAILDNVLYGNPARCHNPAGWPTFTGWPDHKSLTHEQSYWKWLERAWRGGLRLYVNLMVENRVLCEVYPLKQNSCNEMDSVLLQIQRIHEMQDYIDAQSGGPGKGFFRIVTDPFEAREVINDGKMAVVLGMEVSEPFGCRVQFGMPAPACTPAGIDNWLDRLYDLGLRQFEIVNKFDNALTGVAGDGGTTGTVVNSANFFSTGSFWDLEHCDDPENHDHSPTGVEIPHNDDLIIGNGLDELLPLPALPVYPPPPHCNQRGLTSLGEHAIRGLMDRRLIFDPDHTSLLARNEALDLVEEAKYPGMFSSHSWSTPNAMPRIYKLGGVVAPSAGDSTEFVEKWRRLKQDFYNGDYLFGIGYGADQNGFAAQGGPRGANVPNPVDYPFKSFDGKVTLGHQVSGQRVYDINVDGVAHYGLYPDWVEDLRMIAGDEIVRDLGRGAEAYLQMWERTEGIKPVSCPGAWRKGAIGSKGLGRKIRLGYTPRKLLERAGQPVRRKRAWRWCAGKRRGDTKHKVAAVLTKRARVGLVLSTLRKHSAGGIRKGAPATELEQVAEPVTKRLWAQDAGGGRRFLYGVRGGKVKYVALASRKLASKPGALKRHLKRARRS